MCFLPWFGATVSEKSAKTVTGLEPNSVGGELQCWVSQNLAQSSCHTSCISLQTNSSWQCDKRMQETKKHGSRIHTIDKTQERAWMDEIVIPDWQTVHKNCMPQVMPPVTKCSLLTATLCMGLTWATWQWLLQAPNWNLFSQITLQSHKSWMLVSASLSKSKF